MQQENKLKFINVYIPFIEIYLQLEIALDKTLSELAEIIHKVTKNDNELQIFRFKYQGQLQSMQTKLLEIAGLSNEPKNYLTAYAQMTGA